MYFLKMNLKMRLKTFKYSLEGIEAFIGDLRFLGAANPLKVATLSRNLREQLAPTAGFQLPLIRDGPVPRAE